MRSSCNITWHDAVPNSNNECPRNSFYNGQTMMGFLPVEYEED